MNKKFFLELADYNIWANNNAISWLNQIDDEQWKQVVTSSFSSLQQTVMHVASAEKVWIDFWNRVPDPKFLSVEFKGTKNELIEIWKQSSAGLKNFIEKYPEENFTQPITFKWPGGGEGQMEFSQTFSHIINHSTYHRGQLVTILRQLGFTKLSSTDLATYYRIANKIN
jgi:uncharacterized damage-inducible protein DinB